MAVTSYKDVQVAPGIQNVRKGQGSGTPVGDAILGDDVKFPIGSLYRDTATGNIYQKTATGASGWEQVNGKQLVSTITATATSATTDFGSLKVGDTVLQISDDAAEPNKLHQVVTVGTLPATTTVGHFHLVFRTVSFIF